MNGVELQEPRYDASAMCIVWEPKQPVLPGTVVHCKVLGASLHGAGIASSSLSHLCSGEDGERPLPETVGRAAARGH